MNVIDQAQKFLEFWNAGLLCLHPSDTLPSLTAHPLRGLEHVYAWKKRDPGKPCLSLVSSLEKALKFWDPLPHQSIEFLEKNWPGPLTVVWKGSSQAPCSLLSSEGELALRVPRFNKPLEWMKIVLENNELPLPSTSVNASGKASAKTWEEAKACFFYEKSKCFIPSWVSSSDLPEDTRPSTVIRLEREGFSLLREGALSLLPQPPK